MARAKASTNSRAGQSAGTSNDAGSRRDHIMEMAAQLFAEKGLATTTVRDIGNAADILSGSLYYHFDSKESIVKEIVSRYLQGLIESYEAALETSDDPRARLEGLIHASFDAIARQPAACEIFQNDFKTLQGLQDFPEFKPLAGRVQALWMDTIEQGVTSGVLRDDIDPRLFYRFARDAIWFTVRWRRPGRTDWVKDLSDACTSILLEGFATDRS